MLNFNSPSVFFLTTVITVRAGQCSSWCGFISTREVFAGQGHWLSGFSFTGERTRSLPCFTRVVRAVDLQDNILAVGVCSFVFTSIIACRR